MVPRRLLGHLRLHACLSWARFGGGGGAVLAWRFPARGAPCTRWHPCGSGGGAGRRYALVCAGCVGGSVGVAALGCVARARRKNDGWPSHIGYRHIAFGKRAFPCIAFQQMQTLRRHRALQRGQPTSASPSNSTRPSDLPSPSSHSIVPHLTHPLH